MPRVSRFKTEEEKKQAARDRSKAWHKANPERVKLNKKPQRGDNHSQKWRQNNPEKNREYYLKSMYNMDLVGYTSMLEKQGGVCAICKTNKPGRVGTRYFSVDHCHITNKIRGLLCQNCNLILGQSNDDVLILEKAIEYLKVNNV